ncbi:methyltransferase [Hyphomicrobium sp. CS1GBMeth3]|uniref:methyltransferase family protein n=1 Tax=Hyphomicrobium sp. CS1GBMeth3 TaxID=1892845 RepID=UPI000A7BE0E1|nr:methyltransferase [Hyphomicrobium sp. CS1GBMeth3]
MGRHNPLPKRSVEPRVLGLFYALAAFVGTFAFFATFIIFLGNLPNASNPWLLPGVDVGPAMAPAWALLTNALLLTLFCLQHSVMARAPVKRLVAAVVPAPLERATYVHAAILAGFLFILLWQPVPIVLWHFKNGAVEAALWTAFGLGWLLLFAAAISINLPELLGLKQAWAWYNGRAPQPPRLKTNWLYRFVEHPMYVGVILGFWMTPYMTVGHAALAIHLTLYIAVAVGHERRDLRNRFGSDYDIWRGRHPAPALTIMQVGAELSRRYHPLIKAPIPIEMRARLAQLGPMK